MRRALHACIACAFAIGAHAQPVDPLTLKPDAAPEEGTASPLGLRVELWRQQFDLRRPSSTQPGFNNRVVLDFRHEWSLGEAWKLGLSDRLEYLRTSGDDETRNALREIYASRAFGKGFVDAGRINWRNGVGAGFNPTDYLKRGAVIEQGTQSPQALRENRLGTVMLRGQALSKLGSAQLAWIPDVADAPPAEQSTTAPAWDRTNSAQAALLKLAPQLPHQLGQRVAVDLLAHARAGERPQVGANLTWLVSDALLAYAEWSGGKAAALPGPTEAVPPAGWKNALAAGMTWTTPIGVSATAEYQYSGDALTRERWALWQQTIGTPLERELGRLRNDRSRAQAALVQRAWFMRVGWDDAFGNRDVDLGAFVRVNAFDRSRLWQFDATWHFTERQSLRLIGGGFRGNPQSEHGSTTLRGYGSLNWMMFF